MDVETPQAYTHYQLMVKTQVNHSINKVNKGIYDICEVFLTHVVYHVRVRHGGEDVQIYRERCWCVYVVFFVQVGGGGRDQIKKFFVSFPLSWTKKKYRAEIFTPE